MQHNAFWEQIDSQYGKKSIKKGKEKGDTNTFFPLLYYQLRKICGFFCAFLFCYFVVSPSRYLKSAGKLFWIENILHFGPDFYLKNSFINFVRHSNTTMPEGEKI